MAVNLVPLFTGGQDIAAAQADDIQDFERRRQAARRQLAEAMKGRPIQHWTQGAAQMAQAALAGYDDYRARKDREASVRESAELMARLFNGGKPGGPSSVAPTGQPTPSMRSAPRPQATAPIDTLPAPPPKPAPEPPPRAPVAPMDIPPPPPPPPPPSLDIPGDMGAELGAMMPGTDGYIPPPPNPVPPEPAPLPKEWPSPYAPPYPGGYEVPYERTGQFAAPGLMPDPTVAEMAPTSAAPIEPPPSVKGRAITNYAGMPEPGPQPQVTREDLARMMGDMGGYSPSQARMPLPSMPEAPMQPMTPPGDLGGYGAPPVTPSYGAPPTPPTQPTATPQGQGVMPFPTGPAPNMGRASRFSSEPMAGEQLPYARDTVPPTYDARNIPINDYSQGRESTPMREVKGVVAHDVSGKGRAPRNWTGGQYHMTFGEDGINLTRPLDQRAPHAAALNPSYLGVARSAMEGAPIGGQELENGRKALAYLMQTQGLGANDFITHPGAGPTATASGKDPREGAWLNEALKPPIDAIKDVSVPMQGGSWDGAKPVKTSLVSGGSSENLISPTGPQINRQPQPTGGMMQLAQNGPVDAETFKKMMMNPYTRPMALQMLQRQMNPTADLDRRYKEAQIKALESKAAGTGNQPMSVQEYQYWKGLPDDAAREEYLRVKRAQKYLDTGTGYVAPNQSNPAAPPVPVASKITPAQKSADQAFGKDYNEFVAQGGYADAQKNLTQLRGVRDQLTAISEGRSKENLTGPWLGQMPDAVTSFTNPKAVDARQQVEEVVQRNLRIVLGAQFTQKEGEALIARAYNPTLDEAQNSARLGRLITAMEQAMQAKQAAAQYYEQNGTLNGFKGKHNFSMSDIERMADFDGRGGVAGQQQTGTTNHAPKVQSDADYNALPSGTVFVGPDGKQRRKP